MRFPPKFNLVPEAPGVYILCFDGGPWYIGKASNLRRRLRQHASRGGSMSNSARRRNVRDHLGSDDAHHVSNWLANCTIDWIERDEPGELEQQLIQRRKPKLNRRM